MDFFWLVLESGSCCNDGLVCGDSETSALREPRAEIAGISSGYGPVSKASMIPRETDAAANLTDVGAKPASRSNVLRIITLNINSCGDMQLNIAFVDRNNCDQGLPIANVMRNKRLLTVYGSILSTTTATTSKYGVANSFPNRFFTMTPCCMVR